MRLPFPERVSMKAATIFAAILYVVEQVEGTDPFYSICIFLFIIIATFAFNLTGGLTRPSGGFIFFYSTLAGILGWTTKAVLGEPGDSNLKVPNRTAAVFLCGIIAMTFTVFVAKKMRPKRSWLGGVLKPRDYRAAMTGCAIMGISTTLLSNLVPHQDGSLLSALAQVNNWMPLAIIMGVMYEIRRTNGRRSVNLVVILSGLVSFTITGLIHFGKEGMFEPLVCYVIAAAAMRYRFQLWQMAGLALVFLLMTIYLVPYSQFGRLSKAVDQEASVERFMHDAEAAYTLAGNLDKAQEGYRDNVALAKENGEVPFFNEDQGLLDRLQMISADDLLIDATERGKSSYGYAPILAETLNFVPHFLWPEKPDIAWGNMYAHEIGGLIDDRDMTTGVSFSPPAEAYHMGGWVGVLLVLPAVLIVVFWFLDSLCGDTRQTPWGLIVLALLAHSAPESGVDGAISVVVRFGPVLAAIAMVCGYGMPFLVSLFLPAEKPGLGSGSAVDGARA